MIFTQRTQVVHGYLIMTAPPAHGPQMPEIWGTTPLASMLRWKMLPKPARALMPSLVPIYAASLPSMTWSELMGRNSS